MSESEPSQAEIYAQLAREVMATLVTIIMMIMVFYIVISCIQVGHYAPIVVLTLALIGGREFVVKMLDKGQIPFEPGSDETETEEHEDKATEKSNLPGTLVSVFLKPYYLKW